jgi:putative ABC transport system ATP-binding protein
MAAELAAACAGVVKISRSASGDVNALRGIDAHFPSQTVTAVVGPSGAGKSTLLRILAGMDRPTAGTVTVGDREVVGAKPRELRRLRRESLGWVFQRPSDNLISYLTVEQHLLLAGRIRGRADAEERAMILDRLGLEKRAGHLPGQLSGGEQQRVAFAQALVGRPQLVVADEPTAELDSVTSGALIETVSSLTDLGITFVLSTHDAELVKAAGRTLHLRHGAMEAESEATRMLSVIDEAGRIQLPPKALKLFGTRRAVLEVDEHEVRITPP